MGVHKNLYGKWVSQVTTPEGRVKRNFNTEKEAKDHFERLTKKYKQPFASRNINKSPTAEHQDLPVGLSERIIDKVVPKGCISTTIKMNKINYGKISTYYGNQRSRDEAIEITKRKRIERVAEIERLMQSAEDAFK